MTSRRRRTLLTASLSAEAGAIAALFGDLPEGLAAVAFATAHLASAALFMLWLEESLPSLEHDRTRKEGLFFLLLVALVPVLGMAGIAGVVLPSLRARRAARESEWLTVEPPPLPTKPPPATARELHRKGSLVEILEHSGDIDKRMQSVLATRHMDDIDAVPVLRRGLSDREDEVRLIAFAFLDRKEHALHRRINELLERLAHCGYEERPLLHLRVAQSCWELASAGLVNGTALAHVLTRARWHALEAQSRRPRSPGVHLLLGKILLRDGEIEGARAHLRSAVRLGLSRSEVAPYFAEAAFLERDFRAVRESLLELDPTTRGSPGLSRIVSYWTAHHGDARARARETMR